MTCQICGDCTAAKAVVNDTMKRAAKGVDKALKAHKCGNPSCTNETTRKFCSDKCRMQAKRQAPGCKRPAQRWTAKKRTDAEIDAAIDRIAQRAADNGTLGWATLAPQ